MTNFLFLMFSCRDKWRTIYTYVWFVLSCSIHVWLCDLMNCSPPGSSDSEILKAEKLSGMPFTSPGDLPDPGITPASPALAGGFFTT